MVRADAANEMVRSNNFEVYPNIWAWLLMRSSIYMHGVADWIRENALTAVMPVMAATVTGLLVGALASSGKILVVLLFFGALLALALVSKPVALLFLVFVFTFVIGGAVGYLVPNFAAFSWLGYLLASSLFLPAIIAALTNKDATRVSPQGEDLLFYWSFTAFLVVALFSTSVNVAEGPQLIGAVKTYLMYAGVWAALAWIAVSGSIIQRLCTILVAVGLVQWFPTVFQYYYAKTYRLDAATGAAADAVVGTFGGTPDGGGLSAVMTMYLVLVVSAMIQARRDGLLRRSALIWAVIALFIPLFLAEVKALFFYLPIALFMLFRDRVKGNPLKFILSIPLAVIAVVGVAYAYFSLHWAGEGKSVAESIEAKFGYSFAAKEGEAAFNPSVLSRREVLDFWWSENRRSEPVKLFFGHGLGSSKTTGRLPGAVGKKYGGLNIDESGLAVLLWDTGIVGTVLVFVMLFSRCVLALRLAQSPSLPKWARVLANVLAIAFVLYALSMPYRNDFPYAAPMMLMVFASFGLLSWLNKQESTNRLATCAPLRTFK